ncbi:hypothetical protein MNEG_10723 [Monoraphidium neglectum]|uniref:Uncharacterized protein n=1 Tax=Monoraphidium neglectum TaxID=145388 RepID=A0A0D2MRQ5_9CHLO|nr:hypothetical protein MNEG_10723 [Monoraphidium neglectum]KIY97235.1 hypothetical protein MNEG_10723 [Monoraphidium neglectum]|eukprot:XP_013896255.1 hypothetical protein MNEG_10723 [Monoraphidium neglectum]
MAAWSLTRIAAAGIGLQAALLRGLGGAALGAGGAAAAAAGPVLSAGARAVAAPMGAVGRDLRNMVLGLPPGNHQSETEGGDAPPKTRWVAPDFEADEWAQGPDGSYAFAAAAAGFGGARPVEFLAAASLDLVRRLRACLDQSADRVESLRRCKPREAGGATARSGGGDGRGAQGARGAGVDAAAGGNVPPAVVVRAEAAEVEEVVDLLEGDLREALQLLDALSGAVDGIQRGGGAAWGAGGAAGGGGGWSCGVASGGGGGDAGVPWWERWLAALVRVGAVVWASLVLLVPTASFVRELVLQPREAVAAAAAAAKAATETAAQVVVGVNPGGAGGQQEEPPCAAVREGLGEEDERALLRAAGGLGGGVLLLLLASKVFGRGGGGGGYGGYGGRDRRRGRRRGWGRRKGPVGIAPDVRGDYVHHYGDLIVGPAGVVGASAHGAR